MAHYAGCNFCFCEHSEERKVNKIATSKNIKDSFNNGFKELPFLLLIFVFLCLFIFQSKNVPSSLLHIKVSVNLNNSIYIKISDLGHFILSYFFYENSAVRIS